MSALLRSECPVDKCLHSATDFRLRISMHKLHWWRGGDRNQKWDLWFPLTMRSSIFLNLFSSKGRVAHPVLRCILSAENKGRPRAWGGGHRQAGVRFAFARSITASNSDWGHRLMPPSFTAFGRVPWATQRQKVGTEIWRRPAPSRAVRRGSWAVTVHLISCDVI